MNEQSDEFTWEDAQMVVDSVEDYWRNTGMEKEDIIIAYIWVKRLLAIMIADEFPLRDRKFCEVLRGVAHGLELGIEIREKKEK